MKQLADLPGVTAVYEYRLPYGEIPLVIIDDKIDRPTLKKAFGWSTGCVILTHDDLKDGTDVFALRFLHMQQRTDLIGGKNLLKDLELKKEQVRHEMENTLRFLLIDLREMMLLSTIHKHTIPMMALMLDRILVGVEMFGKKHHKRYEKQLKEALDVCVSQKVTHEFLTELYTQIEHLTQKIDEQ